MQLNVLDDLTEAMKALDGSSPWVIARSVSCCWGVCRFFRAGASIWMIVLDTLLIHGPVLILQSLQVATNMHPACPNKIVCKLLAPTDPIREKRRFLAVGTLRAAQDNEALLVTQVIRKW